jgi:hypothetical protein
MAMTTDEQRRERHHDAMRRIDEMNDVLRGVSDDYRRATVLLDEYIIAANDDADAVCAQCGQILVGVGLSGDVYCC